MRTFWKAATLALVAITLGGVALICVHLAQYAKPASYSLHGFKGAVIEMKGSHAFVETKMPITEFPGTEISDWGSEGVLLYKNDGKMVNVDAWRPYADSGKFEHVSYTFNPGLPWIWCIETTEINDGSLMLIPRRNRIRILMTFFLEVMLPALLVLVTARKARWLQY